MAAEWFAEVSWRDAAPLRSAVLGWPEDPVPGDEDASTVHLARLNESGRPTAVVSFSPHPRPDRPDARAVYLWGMGVSPGHQRRGLGTSLLGEVLLRARAGGAEAVWCDARQSAVGFYMRFGGIVLGERYADEVTGLADRRVIFELGDRAAVFP